APLKSLIAKLGDAVETAGPTEVRDALFAIGNFQFSAGDFEGAKETFQSALSKSVGVSSKLDVLFAQLRLAFCTEDKSLRET
ncbi:hypothetical protein ABTD85_22725, partial [Acinetobacter baumannii]